MNFVGSLSHYFQADSSSEVFVSPQSKNGLKNVPVYCCLPSLVLSLLWPPKS